jgi:3-dehydroquinate dehydratase-1
VICVSLAEPSFRKCLNALRGLPMAEIRLDITPLKPEEIAAIFTCPLPLVATFRPGKGSDSGRSAALRAAIAAGASFVDIEADARPAYRKDLIRAAKEHGCLVILSSHSDRIPPGARELARTRERFFRLGADIVKVVHRVRSAADCVRLLSLYETPRRNKIIALGLGREGVVTRVAAPLLGAPFTYASLRPGRETAAGQLDWKTLARILDLISND